MVGRGEEEVRCRKEAGAIMSPQFSYSDLLPIGADKTKYRNIGKNGVSVIKLGDREFLQVSPEALTLLTETAIHDISLATTCQYLERP
jgi:fumarate hydratase class I